MNEEKLLQTLGEVAREREAAIDPRWDALLGGELSPAEEEALLAAEGDKPDFEAKRAAFTPISEDAKARILQLARDAAQGGEDRDADGGAGGARIIAFAFRPRARGAAIAAVATLAVAAALLIVMRPAAPLPAIGIEVMGGDVEVRSGAAAQPDVATGVRRLSDGGSLEIGLAPAEPIEGELAVRAVAARGDEVRALELPVESRPGGSARIYAEVGSELNLAPGRWTLLLFAGRPGDLPDGGALSAMVAEHGVDGVAKLAEGWQVWRVDVEILPR